MKNNNYFRTLLGALVLGSVITACEINLRTKHSASKINYFKAS